MRRRVVVIRVARTPRGHRRDSGPRAVRLQPDRGNRPRLDEPRAGEHDRGSSRRRTDGVVSRAPVAFPCGEHLVRRRASLRSGRPRCARPEPALSRPESLRSTRQARRTHDVQPMLFQPLPGSPWHDVFPATTLPSVMLGDAGAPCHGRGRGFESRRSRFPRLSRFGFACKLGLLGKRSVGLGDIIPARRIPGRGAR
jgi:hypothetical protein